MRTISACILAVGLLTSALQAYSYGPTSDQGDTLCEVTVDAGDYGSDYSTVRYAVDPDCPNYFLQQRTENEYTYHQASPGTVFDPDECGLVTAQV